MDQELLFQASMLERQSREFEEQIAFVDQQLAELSQFQENLKHFESSKEKEMLSSLGKGVYTKTNLLNKELFVEVGAGILVKKTPQEARDIIQTQISKFSEVKTHLLANIESIDQSLRALIEQIEASQK